MVREPATDYRMDAASAARLYRVALLPAGGRVAALRVMARELGAHVFVDLVAQFVGLANSVAANASEQAQNLLAEHGVHPYTAEKINMPTVLGALIGMQLVEGIDADALCHGCAFRRGSIANQCQPTTIDAATCVQPGEPAFMCHERLDGAGQPEVACRGWAQLRRHVRDTATELGGITNG